MGGRGTGLLPQSSLATIYSPLKAGKAQSLAQIPQNYKNFKDSEVIKVYCKLVYNLVRLQRLLKTYNF